MGRTTIRKSKTKARRGASRSTAKKASPAKRMVGKARGVLAKGAGRKNAATAAPMV